MNWLQHPIILENEKVKLVPLENEHILFLLEIAGDERIWEYLSINGTHKPTLKTYLQSAILRRAMGEQYAFTVIDKIANRIIGTTMFLEIHPQNKKLEIGWTWYDPTYWRTGYNRMCKFLMLTYCFEVLKTNRVQLRTAEKNTRSFNAIIGIGAKFEGTIRKESILPTGAAQNTLLLSIIDTEWDMVKRSLIANIYS